MTDKAFRYSYHDKVTTHRDSWEEWATVHLITGEDVRFENLSELTNGFTEIELRMTMNGVEVDAGKMMQQLFKNFEWAVSKRAEELIHEVDLDGLSRMFDDAQTAAREVLKERLATAGVKLPERDEY